MIGVNLFAFSWGLSDRKWGEFLIMVNSKVLDIFVDIGNNKVKCFGFLGFKINMCVRILF